VKGLSFGELGQFCQLLISGDECFEPLLHAWSAALPFTVIIAQRLQQMEESLTNFRLRVQIDRV